MATGIDPPGPLVGVVNILNEAQLRREKRKRVWGAGGMGVKGTWEGGSEGENQLKEAAGFS